MNHESSAIKVNLNNPYLVFQRVWPPYTVYGHHNAKIISLRSITASKSAETPQFASFFIIILPRSAILNVDVIKGRLEYDYYRNIPEKDAALQAPL